MKYFLCLLFVLPCILALEEELVPAVVLSFDAEENAASEVKRASGYCWGTQCGDYCIADIRFGHCCGNSGTACPPGTRCCGNPYYVKPWCCKQYQGCSSQVNMCVN